MNLCLFFEGTGRGVAGKVTNVTRLRDICVDDVRQKLDASAVVLHDAHDEASNLWGAFDRAAAIYPESDCTSLAKDSERMWGLKGQCLSTQL